MKQTMTKIRGFGYLFWHGRHMVYHLLLGFLLIVVVQDQMGIYSSPLVFVSLFGSIFPDFEHLLFFITYGKGDAYTKQIKEYIRHGDWRVLIRFVEQGHKYNTTLRFHNIYAIMFLSIVTIAFFKFQLFVGAIFTGSMVIHYLFDILDDLASLGRLNKNWYRWGKGKTIVPPRVWKELDKTIDR